ncbi:MAG: hypothetical protein LBT90_00980 [Holosporaceae bacterium]|jgi:hypothetical protein|nr:hypothetical protein [Holosporaceae bacterium]
MKNRKKTLISLCCLVLQGCGVDDDIFLQNQHKVPNYEMNADNYFDDDIRVLNDVILENNGNIVANTSIPPDTLELIFQREQRKRKEEKANFSKKQILTNTESYASVAEVPSMPAVAPQISGTLTTKEDVKGSNTAGLDSKKDPSGQIRPELGYDQWDNVSRYLAGMYAPDNFNKEEFANYAKVIEGKFSGLMSNSLGLVKSWSRENILDKVANCQTVFYPFGGPDVAYALEFFPDAQTYVLVGLEPIGNFDAIVKAIGNPNTLRLLTTSLSTYLSSGFFITSEMSNQLTNKSVRGTLPLMLIQLSRLGFTLDKVESAKIGTSGDIEFSGNGIDCVRINCTRNEDAAQKVVYYVRTNLGNGNSQLDNLFQLVKKNNFVTFIKSASYALHDRSLFRLKQFILANTSAVLQDDSGIPFSSFDATWEKNIFGTYNGPTLKIFKNYIQKDLLNFYGTHACASIPFKIGYGFRMGRPNLFLGISSAKNNRKAEESANKNIDDEKASMEEQSKKGGSEQGKSRKEQRQVESIKTVPPQESL